MNSNYGQWRKHSSKVEKGYCFNLNYSLTYMNAPLTKNYIPLWRSMYMVCDERFFLGNLFLRIYS